MWKLGYHKDWAILLVYSNIDSKMVMEMGKQTIQKTEFLLYSWLISSLTYQIMNGTLCRHINGRTLLDLYLIKTT